MKFILLFLISVPVFFSASAQDFSNKGKDFWVGYGYHVRMVNNTPFPSTTCVGNTCPEKMQLYITSDVNTSGTVDIPGVGFSQSFTVTANQITTIDIPRSAALPDQGTFNKGIHVTSVQPVVVYSFIYVNAISGATVCLPTNTLGKEYYSVNYKQLSNEANSHSYFFVIATDTGTTRVEITPSATLKDGKTAGQTFTVDLTQGQIYQALGQVTGNSGSDLTGSIIKSVGTGTGGCKKIAVYCGSGKISIGCNDPSTGSSDNLYQQIYPLAAWGKSYITVPTTNNGTNFQTNFYRIIRPDPSATVTLNGNVIPSASFVNNFYYQFSGTTTNVISSDKPILVVQYFTTSGGGTATNCGNSGLGDPEMIYLNPLEQTISNVTLNSMQPSSNTNLATHLINVVLKNVPGAINSFKIDGINYTFTPVAQDPNYAYARINVSSQGHTITCDSGFNAIAYGFGSAESYGYSAGTNLKDLYQKITIKNQYATVDFPATCKNTPFQFSITLPYRATSLTWDFNNIPNLTPNSIVINNNPVPDDSLIVNGKQIYVYRLPGSYNFSAIGTYPVTVTANNPTSDGCSGTQEINYDVQVYDPPIADWKINHTGCLADPVNFLDATNGNGRPAIKWLWNFGDNTIDSVKNPVKQYSVPGIYNVKLQVITDVGCISDTTKPITVAPAPVAKFGISKTQCIGKSITFFDSSFAPPPGTLVKWYWDFGDGTNQTLTASSNPIHTYSATGVFNVTLKVENNTGCQSALFTMSVTVHPNPVVNFNLPGICLPTGLAQFFDSTTIADGSQSQFSYLWNFGDASSGSLNNSILQNPTHNYNTTGPFTVNLQVTSKDGCVSDTMKTLSTVYPQPKAAFTLKTENCLNDTTYLTDQSNGQGSTITNWYWNFGDGQSSTLQNPSHVYASAGAYTITLYIQTDKGCLSDTAKQQVTINLLPTASFATSSPACETKDVTFSNASAANAGVLTAWNWNLGDGTVFTAANDNTFTHAYSSAGNYTVTLSVESDKGCKSPVLSKDIIANPQPQPGFISPDVCLTDAFAQFTDTSKIASGSIASWSWNFGDPGSGVLNTSTLQNPKHKYNAVGVYTITFTITSNNGCVATITKPFTVNGAVPKANFTVLNNAGLCSNTDVQLQNTSTVDFGNITKVEIYWDLSNNPSAFDVDNNPAPNKIYSHLYPDFQTPLTKTFQVKFRSYSGTLCVDEITKTITVNASPSVQFLTIADTCFNINPFALTQASETGGVPGTGVYSGRGIVSGSNIFNPSVAGVGTNTIRYTFTSNTGCIDYKEQTITIYPVVNVNAGPDRTVLEAAIITLEPIVTGNALQYLWTPNQYLNNNTIINPVVSGVQDITYTLSVTGTGGCIFSDQVFVKVLKFPNVPNTFTPNNDGINDNWLIQNLSDYPNVRLQVFNRYGQVVFESKGYTKPWDGTMNGKSLPFGTYYYVIEPGNGRQPVTGYVTLIK
jgi:gliding motility-associated-like protein